MKVEKVDNDDPAFAFEPFSPSRIIIIASRSQTEVVVTVNQNVVWRKFRVASSVRLDGFHLLWCSKSVIDDSRIIVSADGQGVLSRIRGHHNIYRVYRRTSLALAPRRCVQPRGLREFRAVKISTHAIAISQCHSTTQAFLCKVCGWKTSYVRWESLRKLGLEERGNKAWRSPRRCPWGALYKSCTFRDTALAETCTLRDTHPHRASQRPRVSRVVLFF